MKSKSYILVCCILLFCVSLSAVWFRSKEEFDIVPKLEGEDKAQYMLHQVELVPREDISSFIVDGEKIYILYDNAALVNVYGVDGTYQYGIQISTIKNGHSDIAVVNGKLYIESRRPIIFVFQGTKQLEIFDPRRNQDAYFSARTIFSLEKSTGTYELSTSGNTIVDKNTQKPIIDLPQKSKVANCLTFSGLILLLLVFRGYDSLFGKHHIKES